MSPSERSSAEPWIKSGGSERPPLFWRASHGKEGAKIHQLRDDDERTICGRKIRNFPGVYLEVGPCDCFNCIHTLTDEEDAEAEERRREEYERYRKTYAWRERCAWVMWRSGGWCEACLREPAAEIHHLTYEHIFHEPLFDLVAICRPCHESVTAIDQAKKREKEEKRKRLLNPPTVQSGASVGGVLP